MGGLSNLTESDVSDVGDVITQAPLLEQVGTNLLLRSAAFDNASWNKTSVTVTADAFRAPDGTTTADQLADNSAVPGVFGYVLQQAVVAALADTYTASIFVSPLTSTLARIGFYDGTTVYYADFIPSTGALVFQTNNVTFASEVFYIPRVSSPFYDLWIRVSVTSVNLQPGASVGLIFYPDITQVGTNSVYAWGAQLEKANRVTGYIPTAAAQVTRAAGKVPPYLLDLTGATGILPAVPAAGLILRSDGANWVTSQSSYPDIVGSKNVLVASAANTVASFANFKYDDTAGVGLTVNNVIDEYKRASIGVYTGFDPSDVAGTLTASAANAFAASSSAASYITAAIAGGVTTFTAVKAGLYRFPIAMYNEQLQPISVGAYLKMIATLGGTATILLGVPTQVTLLMTGPTNGAPNQVGGTAEFYANMTVGQTVTIAPKIAVYSGGATTDFTTQCTVSAEYCGAIAN